MPDISIIIPIYNATDYLTKCLNSILAQSIRELEVILINDGSTDASENIIDDYVHNYPNIFRKINKENGDQGSARNINIENDIRRIYNFHLCR